MRLLRVATVACHADGEARVAGDLSSRSDVTLVFRCVDRAETLAVIRGGDVDAVFVVGAAHWLDRQVSDEARERGVRLIGLVADPLEAEHLREVGATLADPGTSIEELLAQAEVVRPAPPRPRVPGRPPGRSIAVWGPKGAPGRTSVAIELAFEIAAAEPSTLLVDADTYGGDVAQSLAMVEEIPTIVWAAHRASTEDFGPAEIATVLRRAGDRGPVVMPGVPRPDLWADISDFGWRKLMVRLRSLFRFTIYDLGFVLEGAPGTAAVWDRNRVTRQTISDADRVVAICRGDPIGLKSFLWAMEELRALVDLDKVLVVANKVRAGDEQEVGYVLRKHLGKRPAAYLRDVPAERLAAMEAATAVRTLKSSSDTATSIADVAAALGADIPPRGFLTRLAGRG